MQGVPLRATVEDMRITNSTAPDVALEKIIAKTGGITSLAAAVGLTEGAVRYWRKNGRVPKQAARIVAFEVKRLGIDVSAGVLSGEG